MGAILVLTLGLLSAVAPLATDTYLPSFPQVASEFRASERSVHLTMTLFLISLGLGQLFWGPLSDRVGRRAPLMVGCSLFVAASILAPLSVSIEMLVIVRALQGFTGAAGLVLSRAVARDLATGPALAQVFSLLGVVTSVAPVVAPVLGGVLADPIGWRGVLWVVAGIGAVMLLAAWLVVRESLPVQRRLPGGGREVLLSVRAVARDAPFVGYALTQGFAVGVLLAFVTGSSFVLQNEYGLSPTAFSLLFALNAVGLILGGLANRRLVVRHDPGRLLQWCLALSLLAAASAAVVTAATGTPPLVLLLGLIWLASLCNAPIIANTTSLGLQRHGVNAGMAAAVLGASMSTFGGLVAQLVSVGGATTAGSMTLVMALSAVLANLAYRLLARRGADPAS